MTPKPKYSEILIAAKNMDWQQVVLNGGPPCFHIEGGGKFCGRAERWAGHGDRKVGHKFISLYSLFLDNLF